MSNRLRGGGTTPKPHRRPENPAVTGTVVEDGDTPGSDQYVVVNTPDLTIGEWDVIPEKTVAEKNPEYDPDEPVVIASPKGELHQHFSYYTGGVPLHLSRINEAGVDHVGFPKSRLRPLRRLQPTTLPLSEISPSPYHARTFSIDGNREFVETIREHGQPSKAPLVRVVDDGFEIINGHKRIWASHVAGVDAVPCRCAYVDDKKSAEWWVQKHLSGYGPEQVETAVDRLYDNLGADADDILPNKYTRQAE